MQEMLLPPGAYLPRHAQHKIADAMQRYRVVALTGPRQAGKTTLVKQIARDNDLPYVSLDAARARRFAQADPAAFVRNMPAGIIDEIQWAPDLILEIKRLVDGSPQRGRYLITGSVELFKSAIAPDSLAGRMVAVELLPLSVAEIGARQPANFLDRAFAADFPDFMATGRSGDLWQSVMAGGFPEALAAGNREDRADWLRNYARNLAGHDLPVAARIHRPEKFARLIELAAAVSGRIVDMQKLARQLEVSGHTVDSWLSLLENMFLLRRIGAWHGNAIRRLIKRPKLHFIDSALAAALGYRDDWRLVDNRPGELLESFVCGEIGKAAALARNEMRLSHFRDRNGNEVDLVVEQAGRGLIGIETTAAPAVGPTDFKGLRQLRAAAGDDFVCGIILHDGDCIQQVAAGLFAMPIAMLWEA